MHECIEIDIMHIFHHDVKSKTYNQSKRVKYKLSLLGKERNEKTKVRVDDDCQQQIAQYDLQHKLTNASGINKPELCIEMKADRDQPEKNMIELISPECFHIQK